MKTTINIFSCNRPMQVDISYTKTSAFDHKYKYWFWYFRKYKYTRGFIIRVFGVYFNIREKNSTEKIINNYKKSVKACVS